MPIMGLVLKEQRGLQAYERRNKEGENDLNSWHNMNEEGISGVFKALTEKADKCE